VARPEEEKGNGSDKEEKVRRGFSPNAA